MVRSLGGNHVDEIKGEAVMDTGPPAKAIIWPTFIKMVRILLSVNGIT